MVRFGMVQNKKITSFHFTILFIKLAGIREKSYVNGHSYVHSVHCVHVCIINLQYKMFSYSNIHWFQHTQEITNSKDRYMLVVG